MPENIKAIAGRTDQLFYVECGHNRTYSVVQKIKMGASGDTVIITKIIPKSTA
jgi:hypothetical protein